MFVQTCHKPRIKAILLFLKNLGDKDFYDTSKYWPVTLHISVIIFKTIYSTLNRYIKNKL